MVTFASTTQLTEVLFILVSDENLPFILRFPFLGAKSVEIKYVRFKPIRPN